MNPISTIVTKARELFATDAHAKVLKRDKRAAVIDYVLEENKRKHIAIRKQAIKHLTYAERKQLGIINKSN